VARGRPKKNFAECSKRTKRRRIAEVAKHDESAASDMRSSNVQPQNLCNEANIEEVLSLFVEANLTKHQYLLIRLFVNLKIGYHLLPSYNNILMAKTKCYPDNITVNESHAEVEHQNLLDHTATRILQLQKEVIYNI